MKYIALLRGINVGGKNRVKMVDLRECFEDLGLENVTTFIQSGNIIFKSKKSANVITEEIEKVLPKKFNLDSNLIRAFVYSKKQFENMVESAPTGFGKDLKKYYYDFIFLKDIESNDAIKEFDPKPEVDTVWEGPGVIYHRRLSAKRSKSRLAKIASKPVYKSMTIRSFTTASKLLSSININY